MNNSVFANRAMVKVKDLIKKKRDTLKMIGALFDLPVLHKIKMRARTLN